MNGLFRPSIVELQKKASENHPYFPVAYPLDMNHDHWFSLYKQIHSESAYNALLESGRAGRYSFMAYRPSHKLKGKDQRLTISSLDSIGDTSETQQHEGMLLDLVKDWMSQRTAPQIAGLPDFQGGLLGFFSYDLVREIEELPQKSADDLKTPDIYLLAFDRVIAYDHHTNQHWLLIYQKMDKASLEESYREGQRKLKTWAEELLSKLTPVSSREDKPAKELKKQEQRLTQIEPSFLEEEYMEAVVKIQEYISAGDVFQVNLSVRQTRPLDTEPLAIYEQLREINPSPYMGYLQFPDLQVISASPEQLVKVKGREITTRPIAGTRPRGENREQDLLLAKELIDNEKERAEHVMLLDLERNDLGKVSKFGSVEVDEFMVIEEYSHVMHIVSNVKGILADGTDAFDVIRAVFPGGTITGAPKVRTMEIIEELEPVRRGIYTGSIGWIDFNGNMELNIVIRTILAQEGQAHVQAGAGIVIDSLPASEYKESLNKAVALWKAFEQSKEMRKVKKKELSL